MTSLSPPPLRRLVLLGLLCTVALGCPPRAAPEPEPVPEAPCEQRLTFSASGFFRVEESCGRWWFVTPQGERFYSTGVNHVSWNGDYSPSADSNPYRDTVRKKYPSEEAWAAEAARRLRGWGWNTVGTWSSYESLGKLMPYTYILDLAQANWLNGTLPDYFSAEWETQVHARAAERIEGRQADTNLIGYFIDNELRWGPDWRSHLTLFEDYFGRAPDSAGKRALLKLLEGRHPDIGSFNQAWRTSFASFDELASATQLPRVNMSSRARADASAFLELLAHRYFSITTGAIRALDSKHLILGVRFVAPLAPREVVKVSGQYLDVVSVNAYEFVISPALVWDPAEHRFVDLEAGGFLEGFHELTGRPVMIGEFGFRAKDSGLPNSYPPTYPTLETQQERADRFEAYARRCFAAPYIAGFHWFEYVDQPATGRSDGENNNWGLVDSLDEPYPAVVARTAQINTLPATFE